MPITKHTSIVTIEYPNGAQSTRGVSIFKGQMLNKYTLTDPRLAAFGYQNRMDEVISLPIPSGEVGDTFTWHLFFAGESDGEPLPPVNIALTIRSDEYYDVGITSASRLFGSKGVRISKNFDTLRFAWAHDRLNYPEQVDLMWGPVNQWVNLNGVMQTLPCLEGSYGNYDTAYYNAMSVIANGYPFGPVTDPDRYVSKPTESEARMEDDSDPIEIDALPSAVVPGGMFRIYEMTNTQMTDLSNVLVDPSVISAISRLVSSPWDYIINLKAMPVTFPGFTTPFRIGNYTPTLASNPKELNTFIMDVDCGSIALNEMYGSFADYSPYTKVTLYCPFCGYIPINIDLFQNNHIKVKYRVDVVSGDCVCFISNDEGLISTLSGNCAYNLPLRANDSSQMISGLFTALGGAIKTSTGDVSGGGDITSGFGEMMSAVTKPHIVTSGSLSANSGSMANRKPYLIIERPTLSIPKTYPEEVGFSSKITAQLGTLKGFTVVSDIIFEHVIATDDEKAEIESLLKQGVEI